MNLPTPSRPCPHCEGHSDSFTLETVNVDIAQPPVACFSAGPTGNPLEVAFTNCSQGEPPLSFAWDFGDGGSSSDSDPVHAYAEPGSYEVTLTVTDGCGNQAAVTQTVEVGGVTPTDRWINWNHQKRIRYR